MRLLLATLTAFLLLTTPAAASWTWPVSGEVITPYSNGTDPYASGQHRGIDIAAPTGASVVAAAGGEVRFAGTAGTSGLTVSIRTADGYDTSYLHLSSLAVRAGGRVDAGDRIGAVGTTGTRSATQPHLHFGVRDAGSRHAYHDPLSFLPPPVRPRAPDPPPAGTSPEPAPAPPAAAPAPARAPEAAPRAAPRPAPLMRPSPRTLRAPRRAPAGGGAPHAVNAPRNVGATGETAHPHTPRRDVPRPALDSGHTPKPTPAARPVSLGPGRTGTTAAPGARTAGEPARHLLSPARATHPSSDRSSPPSGGINPGWALACAGLLLAAGVLGLREGGRRSARRPRVASMVHAVLRHHAHLLRQR